MNETRGLLLALFPILVVVIAELTTRLSREPSRAMTGFGVRLRNVQPHTPEAALAIDARLQQYVKSNLIQVNSIFWLAVSVMSVGFYLIYSGIDEAFHRPTQLTPAIVGAGAGVLTEFIGATFLFIYKSTVAQATAFMDVLERIHRIGVAVQILDEIPETEAALKNQSRAEAIKLLLSEQAKDFSK